MRVELHPEALASSAAAVLAGLRPQIAVERLHGRGKGSPVVVSATWIDPIRRALVRGHSLPHHLPVPLCGSPQLWDRLARMEQRFGKRSAVYRRQPDGLCAFQHAVELQGRTLTDFVIASVHESAVKSIAEFRTHRSGSGEVPSIWRDRKKVELILQDFRARFRPLAHGKTHTLYTARGSGLVEGTCRIIQGRFLLTPSLWVFRTRPFLIQGRALQRSSQLTRHPSSYLAK